MVNYKVPEKPVSMTTNHLYGISETGQQTNVREYLQTNGFGLTADLLTQGFKPADIEEAVNSGDVSVAHWPTREPKTDMYWAKDSKTLLKLGELADEAVRFCYGQNENQPIGGNFATVGTEMESQQRALVGLIYARHQGKLREIPELDQGAGPLYVAKGSFSDKLFEKLFPEQR
ncbi:hypothetical protein J4408_03605 [Candidatus Pacearchaeota archaeon]|nr:hypothetical protein [Candidatus Pacearchaeota archaeon]